MVLTVKLPKKIQQELEKDKQRTGLSKAGIARQILMRHYEMKKELRVVGAA